MTKNSRLGLKIIVSVGALTFAFRNTDLTSLAQVGVNVSWPLLVLAVTASIVSIGFLGLRWQRILKPIVQAPLRLLVRGQYIGLFGNNVFPFRAGEFMRADFGRKRLNKHFMTILTTIFFERLLDMTMAALVFGILLMTTSMTVLPLDYGVYFVVAILLFGGFVIVVVQNRKRIVRLIENRFPLAGDNREWIAELLTYRSIWSYLVLSAIVWCLYALRFQLVLSSINLPLDFSLQLLLLVATAAGFLIPAAPGAIGTYHLAVVFSMHNIYGVDLITAQAASILLHLSGYIPSTLIGFFAFVGSSGDVGDTRTNNH